MTALTVIIPVAIVPFDASGAVDERALRRVVRFELDGGVHGIGVNGFASEAYKLTDAERLLVARTVAEEVGGQVPLVIGIAPGSVEAALAQAEALSPLHPAALMTLPPATFGLGGDALVGFYIEFGRRAGSPVMVQQATHIHSFSASRLEADQLASIAEAAPSVTSFKIEGPGAAERIGGLAGLLAGRGISFFGGGGGITFLDELRAGATGLIPGVGFNERFVAAWEAWSAGDEDRARTHVAELQPLVNAVSGPGHEFSIHARKRLLVRAGLIPTAVVRHPTVTVDEDAMASVLASADALGIRLLEGGAVTSASDLSYVGTRQPRYDGMQHVTAGTRYVGDLEMPGMLHVKAWRSPVPSAWVRHVDVSAAEALPGVVKVITHQDVPHNIHGFAQDTPVLAESEVRYLGQEVAAVAAEDEETARRAVDAIRVELEERAPVLDPLEAMEPGAALVAPGGNLVRFGEDTVRKVRKGDVDAAFAAADVVVEGSYRTQGQEHAPIETQVSVAQTDAMGRTHIWSVGQALFFQQPAIAGILGKPQSKVHMIGGVVGGAFGGKNDLHADHICAVLSLSTGGRPVRWRWTREEEFRASSCRGAMHMWFEDAVTSDGRIIGRRVRSVRDAGAYVSSNDYVMSKHAFAVCGPYAIANVHVDAYAVLTNKRPASSMRGFGLYQASFAEQVQMERIADRLGVDPWRIRLLNAVHDGDTSATRTELRSCGLIEVIEAVAERAGVTLDPDLASLTSAAPGSDRP